jgi:hypothetical protein
VIKKYLRGLMDRFQSPPVEPLDESPLSVRLEALHEFEALLAWCQNSEVTPNLLTLGLTQITTTHSNLVEHLAYMKGISPLLEHQRALTFVNLNYEPRAISLSKYLVASDGTYISLAMIEPFCQAGIKVCTLTAAGETASSGVEESNLRVLRPFFAGCVSVCRELSALYQQ